MTLPDAPAPFAVTGDALGLRRGERHLFDGVRFSVAPGEALFVRGPNGSGKTSLLLVIAGVLRPDAGAVRFAGPDLPPYEQMQLLGHQSGAKARLSVAENLAFWASVYGGRGDLDAVLAETGLATLAALPAGYLSAGQLRRLALGRLLVAPRPLWLLDEPTASLDAEGERLVVRLLDRHLAAGGLAIVATHQDIPIARPPGELRLGAMS